MIEKAWAGGPEEHIWQRSTYGGYAPLERNDKFLYDAIGRWNNAGF
jgi:hypothetical protein